MNLLLIALLGGLAVVAGLLFWRWRQTELRLALLDHDLLLERGRFEGFMALADEAFWESDTDGLLRYASPGLLRLFGARSEAVLGRSIGALAHRTQVDRDGLARLEEAIARRRPFSQIDLRWKDATGVRVLICRGQPVTDDQVFRGMRVACADATQNLRISQSLREQAERDGLTGLLQRSAFLRLIGTTQAGVEGRAWIAVVDIDRMGEFNAKFGRERGDAALAAVADVLRRDLRQNDLAARLDNDRFAVFMPWQSREGLSIVAERLRAKIAELGERDPHYQGLTASLGAARAESDGDAELWIAEAVEAALEAKHAGRDRWVIHGGRERGHRPAS